MLTNIYKLYPQFTQLTDRRKTSLPVSVEYRSGMDRRQKQRPILDAKLNKDIIFVQDTFKAFLNNSINTQNKINQPVYHKNTGLRKAIFAALSPIIPVRRITSLPDNIDDGNYTRAAGLFGLMIFNLPEDCRDMRNSIRQISDKILSKQLKDRIKVKFPNFHRIFIEYKKPYDYTNFQHSFSFFRGTWLEFLLKLPGKLGKIISDRLYYADKPLFDTNLGKHIQNILNISEGKPEISRIFDFRGDEVLAKSVKGGNKLTRLIGSGMLRMPILGIYALSILELPALIKSFKKGKTVKEKAKSVVKQTAKSAMFISAMSSGIGIFGALGFKKFGATGSLIGMGIGSIIGGLLSKKAGKIIDKA